MFENIINKMGNVENPLPQVEPHVQGGHGATDDLDILAISKDEFRALFRRPRNGSLLMKMKQGDLTGKGGNKQWEDVVGDLILVSQAKNINTSLYLISRMVMGHNAAAQFAERAQEMITKGEMPNEEAFLPFMTADHVTGWDKMGDFLKTILPYHKDVLMNHSGLLKKLAGF